MIIPDLSKIRKEKPEKLWLRNLYTLCVKFNKLPSEVLDIPIPTLFELFELMEWEVKEMEREHRKMKAQTRRR